MWSMMLGALALIPTAEAPTPTVGCVRELAAREVAYGECLRVVVDDAKYNRCLAALGRRAKERPGVAGCYRELPSVCLRLLDRIHRLTVRCYEHPASGADGAQEASDVQERARLFRAAKTCKRMLEDLRQGDRTLYACRRYGEQEKKQGLNLLNALVSPKGMDTPSQKDARGAIARCARLHDALRVVDQSLKRLCDASDNVPLPIVAEADETKQDPVVDTTAHRLGCGHNPVLWIVFVLLVSVLGLGLWRRSLRMQDALAEPPAPEPGSAAEPESEPDPKDDGQGPRIHV